jgi:hypothetical protein
VADLGHLGGPARCGPFWSVLGHVRRRQGAELGLELHGPLLPHGRGRWAAAMDLDRRRDGALGVGGELDARGLLAGDGDDSGDVGQVHRSRLLGFVGAELLEGRIGNGPPLALGRLTT